MRAGVQGVAAALGTLPQLATLQGESESQHGLLGADGVVHCQGEEALLGMPAAAAGMLSGVLGAVGVLLIPAPCDVYCCCMLKQACALQGA